MKPPIAVFDFGAPVEEQNTKGQNIYDKMSLNPLLNQPPVPYVTFLGQIDAQKVAIKNALNGGKLEKAILDNATKAFQATVRSYQFYVNSKANGDIEVILGSGFDVSKEPTPVGEMPKATLRWVRNTGKEGEVKIRVNSIRGKQFFEVQYRIASPEVPFDQSMSVRPCIFLLNGLSSLRRYAIRVRAHGPNGPGAWSDEQQFNVL
jgi:hypothetical protein